MRGCNCRRSSSPRATSRTWIPKRRRRPPRTTSARGSPGNPDYRAGDDWQWCDSEGLLDIRGPFWMTTCIDAAGASWAGSCQERPQPRGQTMRMRFTANIHHDSLVRAGKAGPIVIMTQVALVACGGSGNGVTPTATQNSSTMSFFVTSTKSTTANLGGLRGADTLCQRLADAVGNGNKTWRAYLSVERDLDNRPTDARARIGNGPWVNATGALVAR